MIPILLAGKNNVHSSFKLDSVTCNLPTTFTVSLTVKFTFSTCTAYQHWCIPLWRHSPLSPAGTRHSVPRQRHTDCRGRSLGGATVRAVCLRRRAPYRRRVRTQRVPGRSTHPPSSPLLPSRAPAGPYCRWRSWRCYACASWRMSSAERARSQATVRRARKPCCEPGG